MFKSLIRGGMAMVVASTMLVGESRACWFSHCFSCFKPKPVTYAAACTAPACNVCPQQVNYVPQTCYRTEYTCVPCTTCRPVTTCDPCGGAQTVMQPVTTYVRRPVMVPYTTYRPVVTQAAYAAPACGPCSGAAYSSPYYTGAGYTSATVAAPAPGCTNCAGGSAVTYGGAPAAPLVAPPTMTSPGMPAPSMGAPTWGTPPAQSPTPASPNGAPSQTFQPNGATPQNSMMPPIAPIQDTGRINSSGAPQLLDPGRTTWSRPLIGPATVMPAIFRTADQSTMFQGAAKRTANPSATDGWSAAPATNDGWRPMAGR